MKLIRSIFFIINFFAVFCLVMVLAGRVISPEKFVLPAYFTLIFPFILVLNAFFVMLWVALRKWHFLLSSLFLIFSYPLYKPAIPLHINKQVKELPEGSFSLMSYNTWMLGKYQKHTKDNPNNVIKHILDTDADIVCMQEFNVATDNFITHEEMINIFKKYPYKHIYYKNKKTNRKSGIATFSKFPIIKQQTIEIESGQNSAIYSDIIIKGDTVRLINCHLESNNLTERDKAMPMELRKNFDAENLSNVAGHLSRKLGNAYKTRARQADMIAGVAEQSPYKTIVCGDFNDVPLSYTYTTIKGEMTDVFSALGFGFGSSFHENLYKFRIDYMFCDQNFIPLQYQMDKVKYSDHYPLLCSLKTKEKKYGSGLIE